MTTTHDLKCWPEYFGPVSEGIKTVELRKDDRDYQVGDYLLLREFKPNAPHQGPGAFTGRTITVQVTHIARGFPWLTPGYVALSIDAQRAELDALRAEVAALRAEREEFMPIVWAARRYVHVYETTSDGDEARMEAGETLWAEAAALRAQVGAK